MKNRYMSLWAGAAAAALLLGCAQAGNVPSGAEQPAEDTGVDETSPAPDEPPDPVVCTAQPMGALRTTVGDVIYQNHAIVASATHLGAGGCLTGLTAAWSIDDGCELSVSLETEDGAWIVASASFSPGAACGEFWPEDATGSYTLDAAASSAAVLEGPSAAGEAEEQCLDTSALTLVGRLRFKSAEETLDTYLDALGIGGEVASVPIDAGACPAAPALCESLECGEDRYGTECGACGPGMACFDGACAESFCPPPKPHGTVQDDMLTDVVLQDCDGNAVHLHDLCGANAGYVNLFAAW